MIRTAPEHWDLEADVVSIGSGAGGLAAALSAHDSGASALVLERTGQVGGVTAYSLGEVWVAGNRHEAALGIEDSPASGARYVETLGMGYAEPALVLNQAVSAPAMIDWLEDSVGVRFMAIRDCPDYYYGTTNDGVAEGRLLEVEPFDASQLGEWQERTRVSPHVLYGLTHEDIFGMGGSCNILKWDFTKMADRLARDERCLGAGLVGYLVKGMLDRCIPMRTGVNVEELVVDAGGRVIGLRASEDGRDLWVRANKGVVLAVSSYERSPNFSRTVGMQLDVQSVIMPEIDGAHFRLAGPTGARVARVPDVTMLGFCIPGEELQEGVPLWRNAMAYAGLPHSIVVNRAGKRFADEAFYRSLYFEVDRIDGRTQTHPNLPAWLITDAQARAKYPLASIMPGQPIPPETGVTAQTLAELAELTGIDRAGLEDTVARFNGYVDAGRDPEFHRGESYWGAYMSGDRFNRPNPNLGRLEQGPFHAVKLTRLASSGIAAAGIVIDQHARAVGWDGEPIAGLYVAGNSAARLDMGALVQSGMSNARGLTQGWLAGKHAAGHPSDLLDQEIARRNA